MKLYKKLLCVCSMFKEINHIITRTHCGTSVLYPCCSKDHWCSFLRCNNILTYYMCIYLLGTVEMKWNIFLWPLISKCVWGNIYIGYCPQELYRILKCTYKSHKWQSRWKLSILGFEFGALQTHELSNISMGHYKRGMLLLFQWQAIVSFLLFPLKPLFYST